MNLLLLLIVLTDCSVKAPNDNCLVADTTSLKESYPFNKSDILFKKEVNNVDMDEYREGSFYVYSFKTKKSFLVLKDVLIDYSEGWITSDDNFLIFTLSNITLLNMNLEPLDNFYFNENEMIIGAEYNRKENEVYFLLKNTDTSQIDLCKFSVVNRELKKVVPNIKIFHESIEMPFKKMFFKNDQTLIIEGDCYEFLSVDLIRLTSDQIIIDSGNCLGFKYSYNNNSIIYTKYTDMNKVSYEIKEYDLLTSTNNTLIDGTNKYSNPVNIKLYSNKTIKPFLIEIDGLTYYYDFKSFKKINVDVKDVLQYSNQRMLYLDSSERIETYKF